MDFDGDALAEAIDRLNREERRNRASYYQYRSSRNPPGETLEEHIEKYGFLARVPGPPTDVELEALVSHAGMPLPPQLRAFYRRFGGLTTGQGGMRVINLPSPAELLERLGLREGWRRIASLGIVDMALASWGHVREELSPGAGVFSAETLTRANHELKCIGWIDVDGGECSEYVAFDASGAVQLLRFHQDWVDAFRADLQSILRGSRAPVSLADELVSRIDEATQAIREASEED